MNKVVEQLGVDFINNNGNGFGFICIWRKDTPNKCKRYCTVKEWLLQPKNQNGIWSIDVGMGVIHHVKWNSDHNIWEYCNSDGLTINEL